METLTQSTMTKFNGHENYTSPNTDVEQLFNENIYGALEDAMSIKTDDMDVQDFKNLVLFILNVKCQLI